MMMVTYGMVIGGGMLDELELITVTEVVSADGIRGFLRIGGCVEGTEM